MARGEVTAVLIARVEEQIKALRESIDARKMTEGQELEQIQRTLVSLDVRIKSIEDMATKYKSGFLAVLTFGSIIGWFGSNLDAVKIAIESWFKGN